MMYWTEAFSASWPVTKYFVTSLSAAKASAMERAVPSFGARMKTVPLSAARGRRQVGLGQVLGDVEVPVGGDLADDLGLFVAGQRGLVLQRHGLARVLDHEGAVGDLGLQLVPGAFEEEEGVVVGGRAGVQVQVVALGAAGLVDQVLAPGCAHGHAVEGHIVVDRIGVADQAVVGDHLDAGIARFFGRGRGSGGVLRADDQHFDALADQRFDVGLFLGANHPG